MMGEEKNAKEPHKCNYVFNPYCGVEVCTICDDHLDLFECFCGWSTNSGLNCGAYNEGLFDAFLANAVPSNDDE
jgi:hypothetical protein